MPAIWVVLGVETLHRSKAEVRSARLFRKVVVMKSRLQSVNSVEEERRRLDSLPRSSGAHCSHFVCDICHTGNAHAVGKLGLNIREWLKG